MAVYKDKKSNKWYYDYHDKYGKHFLKRGFNSKREAKIAEAEARRHVIKSDIYQSYSSSQYCSPCPSYTF